MMIHCSLTDTLPEPGTIKTLKWYFRMKAMRTPARLSPLVDQQHRLPACWPSPSHFKTTLMMLWTTGLLENGRKYCTLNRVFPTIMCPTLFFKTCEQMVGLLHFSGCSILYNLHSYFLVNLEKFQLVDVIIATGALTQQITSIVILLSMFIFLDTFGHSTSTVSMLFTLIALITMFLYLSTIFISPNNNGIFVFTFKKPNFNIFAIFSINGNTKFNHFSGDRICNESHPANTDGNSEHRHHLRNGDIDDVGTPFFLSLWNQCSHRFEADLIECRLLRIRLPRIAFVYLISCFRIPYICYWHFCAFWHSLHQAPACCKDNDDLCLLGDISCDAAFYFFAISLLFISFSCSLH